jgi:hypothetical protein
MSSHHSGGNDEQDRKLKESFKKVFGEYPNGRMNEHDLGAFTFSVGRENGRVVIRFPRMISVIGFTPDQAIDIANMLIDQARVLGSGKPVTLKIG